MHKYSAYSYTICTEVDKLTHLKNPILHDAAQATHLIPGVEQHSSHRLGTWVVNLSRPKSGSQPVPVRPAERPSVFVEFGLAKLV